MLGAFLQAMAEQMSLYVLAFVKVLLTALFTGIAAYVVGINLRRKWHPEEQGKKRRDLQDVLCKELHDLERHFMASREVLQFMGLDWKRKPSAIHFEKMNVPEDTLLFDIETMRQFTDLPDNLGSRLFHLKVKLRNRNVEFAHVAEYVRSNQCERDVLRDHVVNIASQGDSVIEEICECKKAIYRHLHKKEWHWEHAGMKRVRTVVFEGHFFVPGSQIVPAK